MGTKFTIVIERPKPRVPLPPHGKVEQPKKGKHVKYNRKRKHKEKEHDDV